MGQSSDAEGASDGRATCPHRIDRPARGTEVELLPARSRAGSTKTAAPRSIEGVVSADVILREPRWPLKNKHDT